MHLQELLIDKIELDTTHEVFMDKFEECFNKRFARDDRRKLGKLGKQMLIDFFLMWFTFGASEGWDAYMKTIQTKIKAQVDQIKQDKESD